MITCRECIEFLMAYLDGELPPEQRSRFEEHLRLCPPCVEYLESYKQTVALARGCAKGEAPAPAPVPEKLVWAILKTMGRADGGASGGGCCPRG